MVGEEHVNTFTLEGTNIRTSIAVTPRSHKIHGEDWDGRLHCFWFGWQRKYIRGRKLIIHRSYRRVKRTKRFCLEVKYVTIEPMENWEIVGQVEGETQTSQWFLVHILSKSTDLYYLYHFFKSKSDDINWHRQQSNW